MKTLIATLIIIALLQSTVLPLELVLIILICRAYIKTDRTNLYLAFAFGLLISHLQLINQGLVSIVYLILVELTQLLSKTRLAGHFLLIIPLTFILLSLNHIANANFSEQTLVLFPNVIIESLLSLPIFYIVKLWEERFIVRKEIKLRLRS